METAEAWKKRQLDNLDSTMQLLSNLIEGWSPSKEDHLAAIEAGYNAMKNREREAA